MTVGLTQEAAYIAVKREEAKQKLGAMWLLHPTNRVARLPPKEATAMQKRLDLLAK